MLYNYGIDDTDYPKFSHKNGKMLWLCPVYRDWYDLIKRVFSKKYRAKNRSYIDCSLCAEWRYFSNFRRWVLYEQPNKNWENCALDKDLLIRGNKHYCPENCVYVSMKVNGFLVRRSTATYVGTHLDKRGNLFTAQCRNPFTGNRGYIGRFDTELEAHLAWQAKKHEYACQLADLQEDPRVAEALRQRYAPDKDWTNK